MISTKEDFHESFKNVPLDEILIVAIGIEPYEVYVGRCRDTKKLCKEINRDDFYNPKKKWRAMVYIPRNGYDSNVFNYYGRGLQKIKDSETLRKGFLSIGANGKWIETLRFNFKYSITHKKNKEKDYWEAFPALLVSFGGASTPITRGLEDIKMRRELEINGYDTTYDGSIGISGLIKYYYAAPGNTEERLHGEEKVDTYMSQYTMKYSTNEAKYGSINANQFPYNKYLIRNIPNDKDHSSWQIQIDPEFNGKIKVRQSIKYETYETWLDTDVGGYSQAINSSNEESGYWTTANRYIYDDNWLEIDPCKFFTDDEKELRDSILDFYSKYKTRDEYYNAQQDIREKNKIMKDIARENAINCMEEYYKEVHRFDKVIVNKK